MVPSLKVQLGELSFREKLVVPSLEVHFNQLSSRGDESIVATTGRGQPPKCQASFFSELGHACIWVSHVLEPVSHL